MAAQPRIEIARHAGVCYGVNRALKLAGKAAQSANTPVCTLGPLIHNPRVVKSLDAKGVRCIETPDEMTVGTLIIRAHGIPAKVQAHASQLGLNLIDGTCPFVKKIHTAAELLVKEGYQVIIVGETGHAEVEGILSHAGSNALVVLDARELANADLQPRVGVVVQTTQTEERLQAICTALLPRVQELRVLNTICKATRERQESAHELAQRADVMIVIGGTHSGNTRRLAQICRESCPRTHHIESATELQDSWFDGAKLIGITAGASTPEEHISEVVERLNAQ